MLEHPRKTFSRMRQEQEAVDAWLGEEGRATERQRRGATRGPTVVDLRERMKAMHEAETR